MFKKGFEKLNQSGKSLIVIIAVVLPLLVAILHAIMYSEADTLHLVMNSALAGMITLASYGAVLLVALGIMSRKDRPVEQP